MTHSRLYLEVDPRHPPLIRQWVKSNLEELRYVETKQDYSNRSVHGSLLVNIKIIQVPPGHCFSVILQQVSVKATTLRILANNIHYRYTSTVRYIYIYITHSTKIHTQHISFCSHFFMTWTQRSKIHSRYTILPFHSNVHKSV